MSEKTAVEEKKEITFAEVIPAVDVMEEADQATVCFEIPGSNSHNVSVEVRDSVLSVEAKSTLKRDGEPILYKRAFQLSDEVDVDKISAKTADGVLTLVLPKAEHALTRKITVG